MAWRFGSLEAWKFGGAPEVEARAAALGGDETGRYAATTTDTKEHKGHKDCQNKEPQIAQICCRLRACYRTQDCQNNWKSQRTPCWPKGPNRAKPSTAKDTKDLADWLIGGCGALPHAPAGEGRFAPRRTENRERRTERPDGATKKSLSKETKHPSLQTSKLPIAPAPPARLRRAIKTTTGDAGDTGDAGARVNARWAKPCPSLQASKFPSFQRVSAPTLLYSTSRTSPEGQKGCFGPR